MPDKPATSPSWWQTIPGILTGVAALITAVTGLIVAFNRTGGTSEPARPASPPVSTSPSSGSPELPRSGGAAGSTAAASQPVALPLNRVSLAGGTAVVTIQSAAIEPIDLDRRALKFRVRHLNAGRFPANFWGSSYRLIVDDAPRAPTNDLNEVVAADSAKDGDVVFEVPAAAKNVVLQISFGDDRSRIPLKLP
jgi:hypothetical protein